MKRGEWEAIRPTFQAIREARGLLSLASETGCSRASIAKWAAGKVTPQGLNAKACREVVARHSVPSQVRRQPDEG